MEYHLQCQEYSRQGACFDDLAHHMDEAHFCSCGMFFENENNLRQVGEGGHSRTLERYSWVLLSPMWQALTGTLQAYRSEFLLLHAKQWMMLMTLIHSSTAKPMLLVTFSVTGANDVSLQFRL